MTVERTDTIVIGAGAAGLAAARVLADAGREVVVLEARNRIGGRLFTDRTLCDLPVDLGGELIHGAEVVTWEIARALGLPTRKMTGVFLREQGEWIPFDDADLRGIDPAALPEPEPGESRQGWLERAGIPEQEWPPIFRMLDADGEPFDRVSAGAKIAQLSLEPVVDAYGSADHALLTGYDAVMQALADGIDIRFDATVHEVTWSGQGVAIVATDTRGNARHYTADHAVATFPIGVLKGGAVRFAPPLPPSRQQAIDALGITSVVKLLYGFDRAVFPDGWDMVFDFDNPIPIWWAWDGTTTRDRHDFQVVTAWAAGDVSRRLRAEAVDDRALLELGLDALRRLFDQPDLTPAFATWHDWEADPFALGAYSSVPPGAETAYQALSKPDTGRLLWAGEATIPGQSKTVHGAIASGRRAASAILALASP